MQEEGEKEYRSIEMRTNRSREEIELEGEQSIDYGNQGRQHSCCSGSHNDSQYPIDVNQIRQKPEEIVRKVDFRKLKEELDTEKKQEKEKKQKENTIISLSLVVLVMGAYYYLQRDCPFESERRCLDEFLLPSVYLRVGFILFNSFSAVMQFSFILNKDTPLMVCVPAFLFNISLFLFYDNTLSSSNYIGACNVLHLAFFVILLSFYLVSRCWESCLLQHREMAFIYFIIFFLAIAVPIYLFKFKDSCEYQYEGITAEGIDDSISGVCKVGSPSICWPKIVSKWQDLSYLMPTCEEEHQNNKSKQLHDQPSLEELKQFPYIGFVSNLNSFDDENLLDSNFQNSIFGAAQKYSSAEAAHSEGSDVIFNRISESYQIAVKSNQALIKEREELASKRNEKSLVKNVLLLHVAQASRQSIHLNLPKTTAWFKETAYKKSQEGSNKQNSSSFEFYRYNSLTNSTQANMKAIFYGDSNYSSSIDQTQTNIQNNNNNTSEQKQIQKPNIFEEFKNSGYITGRSSDVCAVAAGGMTLQQSSTYKAIKADQESNSFSCDKSYTDPSMNKEFSQGPNAIVRRCLYGKQVSEYVTEYTASFLKAYKNEPKLFLAEFHDGQDFTGEAIAYLDEPLSNFLKEAEESKLFEDTAIILFSDHGSSPHGLLSLVGSKRKQNYEANQPALFINLPSSVPQSQQELLAANSQYIVSPLNLHYFIQHLLHGNEAQLSGKSLFDKSINQQLQCTQLGIEASNCSCK